ncbi:hypothetical protein ACFXD5_02135 [Streptomyces sp. NPDC059385]|uniref:hypothetical protein n=1 Tax=Streptomyces sp. NPDC059385 TaxID=3346817 RepID=UPI003690C998
MPTTLSPPWARGRPGPGADEDVAAVVPPAEPRIEAVAARLKAASEARAEAYVPQTDWQPIWKRCRKPKSIKAKKAELAKQRKRLKAAGVRRFYGAQSRRPWPRQNRIGSAAARRDARACPGCGTRTPGFGDDAGHRPPSGLTGQGGDRDHDPLGDAGERHSAMSR